MVEFFGLVESEEASVGGDVSARSEFAVLEALLGEQVVGVLWGQGEAKVVHLCLLLSSLFRSCVDFNEKKFRKNQKKKSEKIQKISKNEKI